MSEENVTVVRECVEAWNRGDLEYILERITDEAEWIPEEVTSLGGGSFQGPGGMRRFFKEWSEHWEAFEQHVDEYRDLGDRVLILCHVHAKGRASGLELDQPTAIIFELRDGRLVRGQTFLDLDRAFAAAGLEREETG